MAILTGTCIQAFADAHGLRHLGVAAENMILEKFMDLVEYEEFLAMPKDMLVEVIKQDSLEVTDELMVYRKKLRFYAIYSILNVVLKMYVYIG